MRINSVKAVPLFKGRVMHDRAKTQHEINQFPIPVQESILGNMDTLAQRLKENTPDDAIYKIKFNVQDERKTLRDPRYYYGIVDVSNRYGKTASNKFFIGHVGGSAKNDRTVLSNGEEIWLDGFKDLTQKILDGIMNEEDEALYKKILYMTPSERSELLDVYSRIEGGVKTIMNKTVVASKIVSATKDCPDEIRDAIIGNINTLTQRLDNETPDDFRYLLRVKSEIKAPEKRLLGGFLDGRKDIYFQIGQISATQYYATPNYFENLDFFNDKEPSYGITTYIMPMSEEPYCPTDGEHIYRTCFKPLTEDVLWQAWN